jgi:hypothetical protein
VLPVDGHHGLRLGLPSCLRNRVGNPDGSSFSKTLAGGRVTGEAGLYTRPTDMTVKALFEMSQHMHARLDTALVDSVCTVTC